MSSLDDLLGDAYRAHIIQSNRPAAVAALKDAFARDADLRKAATLRRQDIASMRAMRAMPGGQEPCYVSAVVFELLTEALE